MKQFKVFYNGGKGHEYYLAKSANDALKQFARDVGARPGEFLDAWVETAETMNRNIDFEYMTQNEEF